MSIIVDNNFHNMITYLLEQLGFSAKEARIYELLCQRGPSVVSTLSNLSKIKRTSVYDILHSLLEKNLIITYKQDTYTFFAVDNINKILLDQKEKVNTAETLIQSLKQNIPQSKDLQINYYKGAKGYRQMYDDILASNPKEIVGFMNMDDFYKAIDPIREEQWTKERIKAGIKVRMILQDSKLAREMHLQDKKMLRQTKIIPKNKFPFQTSINIYQNYITFFDSSVETVGVLRIHHPEFYNLQKQIFEMAWSLL